MHSQQLSPIYFRECAFFSHKPHTPGYDLSAADGRYNSVKCKWTAALRGNISNDGKASRVARTYCRVMRHTA